MEYFLTVVEESSFTRAADALHVTQPALSHQVKALERSVGGELLERLPRGVRLTSMGRAFLPHAQLAVRSAQQAERAARAAAGAVGGELHLATV
ncbi:LysR family transcriptional regulator, partial [Streptomyces sp. NRRL S-444]